MNMDDRVTHEFDVDLEGLDNGGLLVEDSDSVTGGELGVW
jgi:hypothetical protein